MDDRAGLDEDLALAQRLDDQLRGLARAQPLVGAVAGDEAAGLVDRREHGKVVHARELEVLGAGAGRDVDDAGALVEGDLVPRDHPVDDPLLRRQPVERALVLEPDELVAAGAATTVTSPARSRARHSPPVAEHVLGVRVHRRGHVRGQRPRRGRPDHERLVRRDP